MNRSKMFHSLLVVLMLTTSTIMFSGCFTLTHVVGTGAKGAVSESQKQWFALWGLVPINTIDVKAMAGGATNYTVETKEEFIDGLISAVLNFASIHTRTVTVIK